MNIALGELVGSSEKNKRSDVNIIGMFGAVVESVDPAVISLHQPTAGLCCRDEASSSKTRHGLAI